MNESITDPLLGDQKCPPNHTITNVSDDSVKEAFNEFLKEREDTKRDVYWKVSVNGVRLTLVSFVLVCILTTMAPQYGQSYNAWYDVCISLFTLLRVVGICTFSVVPANELDVLKILLRKNERCRLTWVSLLIGVMLLIAAIDCVVYLCIPWASSQSTLSTPILIALLILIPYPAVYMAIWHFLSLREDVKYEHLQVKTKYSFLLICYEIFIYSTFCVAFHWTPLNPGVYYDSKYRGLYSSGWPYALVIVYQIIVDNSKSFKGLLGYQVLPREADDDLQTNGKGVKELYMLIYRICAAVAVTFWVQAIESFTTRPIGDSKGWVELGSGLADVLPILIAYYLGHDHCFTLAARIFEYDVDRQRWDGCFMVILLKSCDELPVDESGAKLVWFHRKSDDCRFPEVMNKVSRRRWLASKLQDVQQENETSDRLHLIAHFKDDCDTDFTFSFDATKLQHEKIFNPFASTTYPTSENRKVTFTEWSRNIEDKGSFDCTCLNEASMVAFSKPVCRHSRAKEACESIRETMKKNAKFDSSKLPEILKCHSYEIDKVRRFNTEYFAEHAETLLTKSPRDLRDDTEFSSKLKAIRGTVSEEVSINSNKDKIDFFLSHSWSDMLSGNKIKSLKWFIDNFYHKHRRYPTFWFDQVCVDQNNVTDGISLLPIHIGACNRMLILMGKTYMGRLWCIWELFMLFTFCNTELALERIQILCIEEDFDPVEAIRTFDINAAHCYDPNEEFRLRYLMLEVVGAEALKKSIKAMEKLEKMGRITYLKDMTESSSKQSCLQFLTRPANTSSSILQSKSQASK